MLKVLVGITGTIVLGTTLIACSSGSSPSAVAYSPSTTSGFYIPPNWEGDHPPQQDVTEVTTQHFTCVVYQDGGPNSARLWCEQKDQLFSPPTTEVSIP